MILTKAPNFLKNAPNYTQPSFYSSFSAFGSKTGSHCLLESSRQTESSQILLKIMAPKASKNAQLVKKRQIWSPCQCYQTWRNFAVLETFGWWRKLSMKK